MDVVAFGFPLGRALSPDKKEYPAISINAGRVTSLRLKGGELQHIQIDVALTFGTRVALSLMRMERLWVLSCRACVLPQESTRQFR